jgi:hypothetical protein
MVFGKDLQVGLSAGEAEAPGEVRDENFERTSAVLMYLTSHM